ncbi:MAG: hypothetical protein KC410_04375 [Anaerolineales bacterium]|nr:hypothetical protein [Anaerolineales bacterium]
MMSDESQATRAIETTTRTVTVTAVEPAIDWDAAPPAPPTVVETEEIHITTVHPTPRGPWEFTNSQRIVLALLIWLNLLMLAVGYLAVTGQLMM